MIRISCTNCKTILSIDDAFAGGVCRCQHCGTIQTVPAQARDGAAVGVSGQSIGGIAGVKSHYQSGEIPSGTGLDELAGIVVSSGLSSSRLTRQPRSGESKAAKKQNLMPIVVAAGVIVIVLVFVIIYLVTKNTSPANSTASNSSGDQTNSSGVSVVSNRPNFCGTPLNGNTVIYLLDCGVATQDYLGELKDAAIKSIGTLGSDHKFQILFWNNGTTGAYPENTTAYASQESIASAQKAVDDVAPFGQTDITTALKLAIAQHPDVLVVATGKGWDLDSAWLDGVMALRGSSPVKINTFSLGSNGESLPLKKLATATGGTYKELTKSDLQSANQ